MDDLPLDDEVDLDPELDSLLDGEALGLDGGELLREVDDNVVPVLHHQRQGFHDHLPGKNNDDFHTYWGRRLVIPVVCASIFK